MEIPGKGPQQGNGPPPTVPSCVLVGKQLVDFALHDLEGKPWQYQAEKRGKLMLLDFWGSGCVPCLHTVPHLRIFQNQYGPAGLQVVGISYEASGTPQEQAAAAKRAASRLQINYPLLLGAGKQCPVMTQFQVSVLPTLVLIGENGWIVWRHEGRLERAHLDDLERRIKLWLGAN
jgi:thiol-disulfide isomerase/thioredoxin